MIGSASLAGSSLYEASARASRTYVLAFGHPVSERTAPFAAAAAAAAGSPKRLLTTAGAEFNVCVAG